MASIIDIFKYFMYKNILFILETLERGAMNIVSYSLE